MDVLSVVRRLLGRRARIVAYATLFLSFAASATAGTLTLGWDPVADPNVVGYRVSYGTTSGNYTASVDCGLSTTCAVPNLTDGQRYYLVVESYNAVGLYSPPSLEVSGVVAASASLTSPAQGSALSGTSVLFQWSAGTNATDYKLSVGNSLGGTSILNKDEGTNLSDTVTGLPTNGSPVYVRLWSLMGSAWNYKDYTFTSYTVPPTLTVSPTSVQAGATITVSVTNGPGNPSDWVAMVPSSSSDGAYVAWKYLNGLTTSAPSPGMTTATLQFTAPSTGGTYNFRFFANGSFAKLATSGTVTVTAAPAPTPTISLSTTSLNGGAQFTVTLANGPRNATDWVSVNATSAADTAYISWAFMNGTTTPPATGSAGATFQMHAPTAPGTYNVRWFSNNTFTKLATSATFTVVAPPPPPPGSVTLSTTTVSAGSQFSVTLANGPANPTDWVALYQTGAPSGAYLKWEFLNGTTTPPSSGVSNAALQFTAPTTAGTYEIRWFSNNTFTTIGTSAALTVLPPPPPSVTLGATSVNAGRPFSVTLANGPANPTDWVALYQTGAPSGAYLKWQFMNGTTAPPSAGSAGATLQFTAPSTAGTYEVRWFSSNTFTTLATSATLTVLPPPPPSVTPSATTVNAGSLFTVTLADGPANRTDWAGLYSTVAGDGGYMAWAFMNGSYSAPAAGTAGATLQFVAPATPGTYNVRWFANGSFSKLATSATITVQPAPPPSLSLSATTVARGGVFTVTVANGPANPTDWVALVPTSAPNGGYISWKFMNGITIAPPSGMSAAILTFVAPVTPGTYNIRFFSNNTFNLLATSATITVP